MRRLLFLILLAAGCGPLAAEPVTFGDHLHAKFLHPRCLACHQFNTSQRQGLAFTTHRSR